MSWLGLYAPAPTIEGIWDQCTATAQAAQGPHEDRTLTQLWADIAAALLLNQSLAENHIFAPAPDPTATADVPGSSGVPDSNSPSPYSTPHMAKDGGAPTPSSPRPNDEGTGAESGGGAWEPQEVPGAPIPANSPAAPILRHLAHLPTKPGHTPTPLFLPEEPTAIPGEESVDDIPEPPCCDPRLIPVFDDPDYSEPAAFREPDVRNSPEWIPNARPPRLITAPEVGSAQQLHPNSAADPILESSNTAQWPPLPTVMPIVLILALSMLGATDEPAWMEGAGSISMEVAKSLASSAPSLYRLLVDPLTGNPLDIAPDHYRVSKTMQTALRIRDEHCQFPGCMAKACTAQIDHIKSFDSGGSTSRNILECCASTIPTQTFQG